METQITFGTATTQYLTGLEDSLGVPVRVLHLVERNYELRPSDGFDGLTIASHAVAGGSAGYAYEEYAPPEFYTNGETRTIAVEGYTPGGHDGYELVELAEHLWAQVAPGVILYSFPLNGRWITWNSLVIDHEFLFGQLVAKAMDSDLLEGMAARRAEVAARRWTDWCTGARNRALTDVRSSIEVQERAAAGHQRVLAQTFSTLRSLGEQATAIEAAISMSAEDWQHLWDKLEAHPRITAIEFNRFNNIVLTTDMITMKHPRHGDRTLGRFEVTLGVSGNQDIVFKNLDYPRNGRMHPHIPSDGNACWGDVGATIAKYMGEMKLEGLIEMLFMFLESFNENDDWGRFAALWYDVEDALEVEAAQLADLGLATSAA